MQDGIVRWYSAQGFGFIDPSSSTDGVALYFHITTVKHRTVLKAGDKVTFDTIQGLKGLKCINIVRVSDTKEEIQCPQTQNRVTTQSVADEFRAMTEPFTPILNFLARASTMVERGIPIVPLPAAKKDPPPKGFPTLATTDIVIIKGWLVPNGKPAIASKDSNCACVAKPDGFWFFDIDNMPAVSTEVEKGTGHKLQEIMTLVVRSSGEKRHLYFKQNDASRALGNFDYDSAEVVELFSVRGNNKYVVSPSSVHPDTGNEYEITRDLPIIEAPCLVDGLAEDRQTFKRPAQGKAGCGRDSQGIRRRAR